MNEVKHLCQSNNSHKRTISRVTTAKSSYKHSAFGEGSERLLKSQRFQTLHPIQPQKYLKTIRKNMFLFPQCAKSRSQEEKIHSFQTNDALIENEVWKFTISIQHRFNFNNETIGLGICFYLKLTLSCNLVDERPLYLKKFQMSASIYLAAKTIQLERKIPKPSVYQYFCGQNYTSDDYNAFERQLIEVLCYDLQKTTIFTFLHLYLSMGVFCTNEILQSGKQIQQLENEILQRGLQSFRTCHFLAIQNGNPQMEAMKIIKQIRQKYFINEENQSLQHFWNNYNLSSSGKKRSSCLTITQSVGNLFGLAQNSSYYTDRLRKSTIQPHRKEQKEESLSRKKSSNIKLQVPQVHQILRRKPYIDKCLRRKNYLKFAKTENLKYVALKEKNSGSFGEAFLEEQLMRCRSASSIGSFMNVAMKFQKISFNLQSELKSFEKQKLESTNLTLSLFDQTLENKQIPNSLKMSNSTECLHRLSPQSENKKKIFNFIRQDQDRVIEKSSQKSKHSKQKISTELKRQKYFNRKNKVTSNKLIFLNHNISKN